MIIQIEIKISSVIKRTENATNKLQWKNETS